MKKSIKYAIVGVCAVVTFGVSLVQLAIGFYYIVDDGQDASEKCQAAPDLPVLLAIGGVFSLFFLGTVYGLLKMISSIGKVTSDVAGSGPKILLSLISFIFGALTLIFFILIQIRVYGAYGKNVQSTIPATNNFCRSALIRGALAMIILTYINVILFSIIVLLVVYGLRKNIQKKKQIDMEMVPTAHIDRL